MHPRSRLSRFGGSILLISYQRLSLPIRLRSGWQASKTSTRHRQIVPRTTAWAELGLQATLLMDEQVAGGWTRGEAVASRVVHLRGVLGNDDIAQLDSLYARIRREEADNVVASAVAAVAATTAAGASASGAEDACDCPVTAAQKLIFLPSQQQQQQLTTKLWRSTRQGPMQAWGTAAEHGEHCARHFNHPNLTGYRDSGHITAYLHCQERIQQELPAVLAKVIAAMRSTDSWGLLAAPGVEGGQVRVCEYHDYTVGGAVSHPKHCDSGSLVTMSVLINDMSDFTGGAFTTLEADGTVTRYDDLQRGDGLVFVSEKWHSVQPVLSGCRRTLVTELWSQAPWPWGRRGPSSGSGGAARGGIVVRDVGVAAMDTVGAHTSWSGSGDESSVPSDDDDDDDDDDEDLSSCTELLSPSAPEVVATARAALIAIYTRAKPEYVPRVDKLLERMAGVEAEFVQDMREKYK
jgi:hypothetical protein